MAEAVPTSWSSPRFFWELYLKPLTLRLFGLGYLALSITVFMSEMTLFKGQSSGAAAFTRGRVLAEGGLTIRDPTARVDGGRGCT